MDNKKEILDNLDENAADKLLAAIQATYLKQFGSKYMEARLLRRYHQTFSPKALAHKKSCRKMARSSRQLNRRRANGK